MGWLLALDGATEQLALALVDADGRGLTRELPGGAKASATLMPAIQQLLAEAALQPDALSAIAFGQGPGAFTGLRSVCALAQGLAWGWKLPVLPIDSLLVAVEAARPLQAPTGDHWGAVQDARMGELYAARYRRGAQGWETLEAPGLWTPAALLDAWQGTRWPDALAGTGVPLLGTACEPAQGDRAAALGRLAAQAARQQSGLDAAQALPLYVRDKVALTTAEREAQR